MSAILRPHGEPAHTQEAPAPLQISNGFTDDLFPVDEAVRYYNYERAHYPGNPISLVDGDFGHMRAQKKSADQDLVNSRMQAFMDHYVKGTGSQPQLGVTATTETCPKSMPSGGPFSASRGRVRLKSMHTQRYAQCDVGTHARD